MPSAFRRSGSSKRATPSGISGSSIPVSPSSTSPSSSSSSHRTAVAPAFRLRGVKPWQGGSYLTSVGLNDLDSILGGGQVLGTSIVLEEDRLWTRDLAITLVKYWCAEVCNIMFCYDVKDVCMYIIPFDYVDVFLIFDFYYSTFIISLLGHITRTTLGDSDIFETSADEYIGRR